ncbi:MAG: phosphate ABC transporter substrate-binding protein PstS [Actinomycetota bacterium]|nr:phosphate ABC transporter substrate-binding protein PstS [Actinomycetota bacterium]MDP9462062.1 phosphate ABC transporter substrate-binding protein PstS [Actinomycetota bacterium]
MKLSRTSRLTALLLGGALALTGCASESDADPAAQGGTSDLSCATGSVTAAGSSAQKNAMDDWVKAYQSGCSGATINYQSVGSGAGVEQFIAGTVDFAGSDSALKDDEQPQADKRCAGGAAGGTALNLPMVTGPVAIAYNLPGVEDLVLDAATTAGIFAGKITTWKDPAITALNEGAQLPSSKIAAFHRSDESGTTDNVQKYLEAAAPEVWTFGDGKKFAAPGGLSAAKSDGVTQAVTTTPGAITYVELSYAENAGLGIAQIDTGAKGDPVALTAESAGKAVEAAKVVGTGSDLALELDYATDEPGAYPIILVTYEIACSKGTPADALDLVKGFLTYTASEDGQAVLEEVGYAPLPASIRERVAASVETLA